MNGRIALVTVLCLALLACKGQERMEVQIMPSGYAVGAVSSQTATDAVDEVVRRHPDSVLIHVCTRTPHDMVTQFQSELDARYKAEVKLSVSEHCR